MGYSQNSTENISYLYDQSESYNYETITSATNFEPLTETINRGLKNGIYWLKVSPTISESTIIQIPNSRISKASAYQEKQKIPLVKNERFLTFNTTKKATIYLKINTTREAFIPICIQTLEKFSKNEKINFLILGLYYGFAFVIFLINLFYYVNFKDFTFLYYALFLFFVTVGFFISDGLLFFFNYSTNNINSIEVFDHFFVVLFGIHFASTFLQIDNYYPKGKKIIYSLSLLVFVFGIIFLITKNHFWYVLMETFVFIILTYFWLASCFLFQKNLFTKTFAIAYFFILLFGLLFYITKLYGVGIVIDAFTLKIGGFLEMVILSFAVVYRMSILKSENEKIRLDLEEYLKQISSLSSELTLNKKGEENVLKEYNLSPRESEILELVSLGKTNKLIAEELFISINTVKTHIKNIYEKLNIKSRKEIKVKLNNL